MPRTLADLALVSDRQQSKLLHEPLDGPDLLDVGTVLWMIATFAERYARVGTDGVTQTSISGEQGDLLRGVTHAMRRVQALNACTCRDEIVAQLLSVQRTMSQIFAVWMHPSSGSTSLPARC